MLLTLALCIGACGVAVVAVCFMYLKQAEEKEREQIESIQRMRDAIARAEKKRWQAMNEANEIAKARQRFERLIR